METEMFFKALMLNRSYVDVNMLVKGIYFTTKPFIYYESETIETLVERCIKNNTEVGGEIFSQNYIDNLKQCELVPVAIVKLDAYKPY